jgi:hypothetical protein
MTDQRFSIVVRGGTVVLPQGVARVDIGIRDETIAAIGEHLGAGITEIDAAGRIVTPGGVDPHAHIEQISGGGHVVTTIDAVAGEVALEREAISRKQVAVADRIVLSKLDLTSGVEALLRSRELVGTLGGFAGCDFRVTHWADCRATRRSLFRPVKAGHGSARHCRVMPLLGGRPRYNG